MNKKLAVTFWILTALCFVIIFYFSSRTADESASQSSAILQWLISVFDDNGFTDFIVRKSAHFMEYTGTAMLINAAWYFTKGKKQTILSVCCVSLYAVTDEIHQIFVDGRSCEVRDWGIDTCGAILGTVIFLTIFAIIKDLIQRKKV